MGRANPRPSCKTVKIRQILPGTAERVERNTSPEINAQIERRSKGKVEALAHEGPAAIEQRISELEREWDIERALEMNASLVVLASTALGSFVNRKWFALTAVASGFLLQHALQGWCPPLPIMRRCGVRTQSEIDAEKLALRILRGDLHETRDPGRAMAQARRLANGRKPEQAAESATTARKGSAWWMPWPWRGTHASQEQPAGSPSVA